MSTGQIDLISRLYRFYLLKGVQDAFTDLDAVAQAEVQSLLTACNVSGLSNIKINREIGRYKNLEVRV